MPRDRKAQKAAYRAEHAAEIAAYQRAYRAANPDARVAESRAYYVQNQETLKAKSRDWRLNNPEKYEEMKARARIPAEVVAPEELEARDAARKERRRASRRKHRAAHPDAHAVNEQNRRARKRAGGRLPQGTKSAKLCEQKGRCVYCRADLSQTGAHLDHRMPLALGGLNTPDNVQLLCPRCNHTKGAKHPDVFEVEIGFSFAGAAI